eukprot:gnl/TRDRNA2_/TRDRNA2_200244_c0_seq1.p1 gnl/TRDRNA2_/TRDRNA2_200244_c0~~gnl/TRDRNA2_/TRDRNA2_200244_c0_seq1.p1  ORF type:complete len:235 (+),score=18.34 gnl/TRDRNA2_/TRDRNA2_200244_c0_seq1:77-781(+)
MFVASRISYGGGQLERSQIRYESVPPGVMRPLPDEHGGNLVLCLAFAFIGISVPPALVEVGVYLWKRDVPCDRPLAMWLLVDGVSALVLTLLSIFVVRRLLFFAGDESVEMTRSHEDEHGTTVAAYEQRSKQMTDCELTALRVQQYASCCPVVLLLLGWIWVSSSGFCDSTLWSSVHGILAYKVFAGLIACCCAPCFLGAGFAVMNSVLMGRPPAIEAAGQPTNNMLAGGDSAG